MKKLIFTLLSFLPLLVDAQTLEAKYIVTPAVSYLPFLEFKPANYATSTYKHPLIISLHGQGEVGTGWLGDLDGYAGGIGKVLGAGLGYYLKNQHASMQFTVGGRLESFVVLLPNQVQNSAGPQYTEWDMNYVDGMIDYAIKNLQVDPSRIFLTGYSLGGMAVLRYVSSDINRAKRVRGVAAVSGFYPP